jgi:hypothetical protein
VFGSIKKSVRGRKVASLSNRGSKAMHDQEIQIPAKPGRLPWNKGKLTGAKPPLRPKHIWSIRSKLQLEGRTRDLAMFNLAIDSKLRGRSRGFWEHFYPLLQRNFPEQLSSVPLAAFYRAINKVVRSLIRTDADEMTYNRHIMLRFDLEIKLLEGKIRVKDLPEAWHAAMQADVGIAPSDDRDGCRRTRTGIPGTSAVNSRVTRSAMFYRCSFMPPRSGLIPTSRTKSPPVNSGRCTSG